MKQKTYVYGLHAVRHIFEKDISRVIEIWVQAGRNDAKLNTLLKQAKQQQIAIQSVPKKNLDKLTENGHHQGIVIRYQTNSSKTKISLSDLLSSLTKPPFLLVLDEVQDPHNLGACLRTADAAGIDAMIVPENRACQLTSIVRAVACGATENVPLIQVTNLTRTLSWLQSQGVWVIGTDCDGQTKVFDANLTGPLALVLGSEGKGLRRLTKETCDVLVHIPMFGRVESLNVSVATGVILYEAVRQRLKTADSSQSSG
jgi:23S rRNA (guanosine2251-2'-O)-methyltransferase